MLKVDPITHPKTSHFAHNLCEAVESIKKKIVSIWKGFIHFIYTQFADQIHLKQTNWSTKKIEISDLDSYENTIFELQAMLHRATFKCFKQKIARAAFKFTANNREVLRIDPDLIWKKMTSQAKMPTNKDKITENIVTTSNVIPDEDYDPIAYEIPVENELFERIRVINAVVDELLSYYPI